jgi:DNA polymerase/3'-5' exonuclease PolX
MIADVPTLPRNDQLAEQFELLADLLELDAADSFRVNAYRRAAARIRETPASVAQLALDGKARRCRGSARRSRARSSRSSTTARSTR